jgi:hypothetical protein
MLRLIPLTAWTVLNDFQTFFTSMALSDDISF